MKLDNKNTKFYLAFQSVSTLLFLLISISIIYFNLFPEVLIRPFVPLHYNIHNGVDLIGPWWQLFIASGVGLVIGLINSVVGFLAWKRDKSIMIFLTYVTITAQMFLMLSVIFIVRFNISFYG